MTEPSKITSVPDHQPAAGGIAARARASVGPKYLSGLNPEQREAVETLDGPVLVLAGAGTGKTRVLTTRIAHILSQGRARPAEILSVTFTNKAAREMKHRLGQMLGHAVEGMPWLGTFHSIGGRILRVHAELAQLKSNFTVLDVDDQVRLLKQLLQAENIDDKRWPARMLAGLIDGWKNRGLMPSQVPAGEAATFANGKGGKLYASYQERLKILNAADFGDLLLENIRIFREHPDILRQYQQRFKFILVDEYQDTNVAQYLWLRLLSQAPAAAKAVIPGRVEDANPESRAEEDSSRDSGSAPLAHPGMTVAAAAPTKNICCVGDDDQSIYGWRGAEVDNILRFEHDFPGAKVIRLERNYRSTGHILAAASHLIAHNEGRLGKTLRTEDQDGEKVTVTGSWDSEEEARGIGEEIEQIQRRGEKLNEIAILVRASYQMREFEDRFVTLGLPYRVIGGPRFYERAEIRDALAYLRVINSPADDLAFERIVNVPKRGLGDATVQMLHDHARKRRIPLFEAARAVVETDELKPKARGSLRNVVAQFDRWRAQREVTAHTDLAQIVLDESGYTEMWQKDRSADAAGRLENLKEPRALDGGVREPARIPRAHLAGDGPRGRRRGGCGVADDAAFGQGARIRQRVPARLGGRAVSEPAHAGRTGPRGARRRTPARPCRPDPRPPPCHDLFRHQPPHSWHLVDHDPVALPRRIAGGQCRDHRIQGRLGLGRHRRLRRLTLRRHGGVRLQLHDAGLAARPGQPQSRRGRSGGGGYVSFEEEAATFSSSSSSGPDFGSFSSRRRGPLTIEGELVAKSTGTTSDFSLDDRVFHQKFGYGRVTKIDGNKLTIAFDKAGEKKVVDSFVQRA
ncbi:ATP-dependent helicase [Bradyrhizobium guangxiense]